MKWGLASSKVDNYGTLWLDRWSLFYVFCSICLILLMNRHPNQLHSSLAAYLEIGCLMYINIFWKREPSWNNILYIINVLLCWEKICNFKVIGLYHINISIFS